MFFPKVLLSYTQPRVSNIVKLYYVYNFVLNMYLLQEDSMNPVTFDVELLF